MRESEKKRRKVAGARTPLEERIPAACMTEPAAVEFVEGLRWPNGASCPECGSVAVYAMTDKDGGRNKRFLWRCREKECGRMFTVRIGTIFEESRIPLRIWLHAMFRACSSKKGISALQVKRETGLSYKSALFMMHRIRFAMSDNAGPPFLSGMVEADETFMGGKRANMHAHKRRAEGPEHGARGRGGKTVVFAMVQRGGEVRASVVPSVTSNTLRAHLARNVAPTARVVTDAYRSYREAARGFAGGHGVVDHSRGQYAVGEDYTNTVESYFALLKRKIYGTHHAVSPRLLPNYLREASFLWNTRAMNDGERTAFAIRGTRGKRLRYKEPRNPNLAP